METDLIKDYITSFQEKRWPSMVPRELKIAKIKRKATTIICSSVEMASKF